MICWCRDGYGIAAAVDGYLMLESALLYLGKMGEGHENRHVHVSLDDTCDRRT